ncbi:MAG TPA: hypothetical protein VGJ05_04125 [Fimbriiglobus sp.]|jgi:hypothetical protein
MQLQDAMDRLDQIHGHLTRSEVYRGFRVPTVALVGAVAILAAGVQAKLPGIRDGSGFVGYWVAVAGIGGLLGTAAGVRSYFFREDEFARRRSRRVLFQFGPCLLAGGAVTVGVMQAGPGLVAFLPGIWGVVFGLGMIAACPYLPRAVGPVGLGYVVAGSVLLICVRPATLPSAWAVGGLFGAGHFATALALWFEGEDDA